MSDSNLGQDGTIPDSDDGIAVGHVPDGSHFNPEEEGEDTSSLPDGEGDTASGGAPE
ncbi:hypothetical protein HQQ81_13125 [Microbacteriaceae bacterium VKM Ac-2854]|nr:hypothetical protein [Microbacteriaceae bacterium VKM Ac-2854]